MFLIRLLLLVVLSPFILLARLFGFGRGNMINLPEDHPEMAKAIADAKAGLPEFLRLLGSPQPDMDQFSVKVRFPVEGGHEHIWVSDLELRDSTLVGKLGNDPRDIPELKLGSSVVVKQDDITDWSYVHAGVHRGHYTTKLLLQHMPKRIRQKAEQVFGWTASDKAA
jgi:uncharacterized protein YegJ (DUF2314 family)